MEWHELPPNLPERRKPCEVELKNGTKAKGYLTIARGWFSLHGGPLAGKSPIKRWRYLGDNELNTQESS